MPKPKMKLLGKATKLNITQKQYEDAKEYGLPKKTGGGYQDTYAEIARVTTTVDGNPVTQVYDAELAKLKKWAAMSRNGNHQQWARDVLTANGIVWPKKEAAKP